MLSIEECQALHLRTIGDIQEYLLQRSKNLADQKPVESEIYAKAAEVIEAIAAFTDLEKPYSPVDICEGVELALNIGAQCRNKTFLGVVSVLDAAPLTATFRMGRMEQALFGDYWTNSKR